MELIESLKRKKRRKSWAKKKKPLKNSDGSLRKKRRRFFGGKSNLSPKHLEEAGYTNYQLALLVLGHPPFINGLKDFSSLENDEILIVLKGAIEHDSETIGEIIKRSLSETKGKYDRSNKIYIAVRSFIITQKEIYLQQSLEEEFEEEILENYLFPRIILRNESLMDWYNESLYLSEIINDIRIGVDPFSSELILNDKYRSDNRVFHKLYQKIHELGLYNQPAWENPEINEDQTFTC